MIVIDHTEPNWAKKYKLSGRENGAASYSIDIVNFHVPVWKKYFPDATVSTCAMIRHKVDTDILIQYIHDNHKDDPIKDFHEVSKSAKRVIFVVAYEETRELAEAAGYEAVFVPMGIDIKKIQSHKNPSGKKKNAMIFFGNLYPRKLDEYMKLREACDARGIELHTISMNKYSKGQGKSQKTVSQSEAWKIVSTYKYAAAIGRCYHESVALGCKTLIVGQEFRGGVLSKKDHIAFSKWNYNPRSVIGSVKSLGEGLDRLDDIKPFVYDISETAKILDKSLLHLEGRAALSRSDVFSAQALNKVKRQSYARLAALRLRSPHIDRVGDLSTRAGSKAIRVSTRLSAKILPIEKAGLESLYEESSAILKRVVSSSGNDSLKIAEHGERDVVAVLVDDFTSQMVSQKHLDTVVAALDEAKIDYFLIPQPHPHRYRVGILRKHKQDFYEKLVSKFKNTGLYVAPDGWKKMSLRDPSPITEAGVSKNTLLEDAVRVFSYTLSPHGVVLSGMELGCYVEFWSDKEDLQANPLKGAQYARLGVPAPDHVDTDGTDEPWVAPKRNSVSAVLNKDSRTRTKVRVGGKDYKTFNLFSETLVSDVDFPIDVVYTWVNGDDPSWRKKFEEHKDTRINSTNNSTSRYMDHQEMKYSLRSIRMFAPWVRNIYIVTDNQVPDWLDANTEGIKVIDHKEIFSDHSVLPVFNSHAIGTRIHHIQGLSEHFIYFNDDFFLGRPLAATEFFEPNGLSKQRLSRTNLGVSSDKDELSARYVAQKNAREMIKKELGKTITYGFPHVPAPLTKSVNYELEKVFSDTVNAVSRSRFRSKEDISLVFLARQYALATGRAVETKSILAPYIDIASNDLNLKLEGLQTMRPDTFCLNEAREPEDMEKTNSLLHDFLEKYYPYPSPWEKR